MSIRSEKTLNERLAESNRILSKYPDRRPVIVERSHKCSDDIPIINKNKYLVPLSITMGQFIYVVRKRIHLSEEKALFLFVHDYLPSKETTIATLYDDYKSNDGFLYVQYEGENIFGN